MSGSSYDGQPPIAERFRKLLCDGMTPADAISHLDELYHGARRCTWYTMVDKSCPYANAVLITTFFTGEIKGL